MAKVKSYRRKGIDKGSVLVITLVVAVFAVVIWTRIGVAQAKSDELDSEIEELESQYKEEEDRMIELEERKVYVQTRQYIEDIAKQLGLLYPDEMLYRPDKKD